MDADPGPAARPQRPVAIAAHNRDVRKVLGAFGASVTAEWALWSALLVYAHDAAGPRAAGFVSIGLLLPAAFVAPRAGALGDGPRPHRLLALVYLVQAGGLIGAALAATMHFPLVCVVGSAAVTAAAVTFVRPTGSVVLPGLVTTPDELTAANLLISYCANGAMVAGPLLAGLLLGTGGPTLAFGVCATVNLLAAAYTAPLARLDNELASRSAVEPVPVAKDRPMRRSLTALARKPGAGALMGVLFIRYVLIGALDLTIVLLARDTFDLGVSVPGLFGAAIGAGGLVGCLIATVGVGRQRLAPIIIAALAVAVGGLAILGSWTTLSVTLVALPLIGGAQAVADVVARILLQRTAPPDTLASVFAAVEVLAIAGLVAGAATVQVLLGGGIGLALIGVAAFPAVILAMATRLWKADTSADVPIVALRALQRIPTFAVLPGPALEGVARAARLLDVPAGQTVVRSGDPGDAYYAIVSGAVTVTVAAPAPSSRVMTRGEGFGEIALLSDVTRTATVTVRDDAKLLRIERPAFLRVVVGHDAARRTALDVVRAYEPL